MQTILGANGVIGKELAAGLTAYTNEIRLVSRNPKAVNKGDQLMAADLTLPLQVDKAVEGSDIVYLTVGLAYNFKIWRQQWPLIMHNVIESCKKYGAK
ncbi:MAG TPA: NAD(P)H-binding protein, partial [Lentimicrobium sp.]|nr:NAD(P)H-binding protein [Lentimicrobium sp.]